MQLGWKLVESLRDAEILKSLSPASQCEIMILAFISFEMVCLRAISLGACVVGEVNMNMFV